MSAGRLAYLGVARLLRRSEGHFALSRLARSFQKSQRHALSEQEAQSRLVAAALRKAFPNARSEADLAKRAAPHFRNTAGGHASERTVRYWLRGETLPDYMNTRRLMEMVGPAFFFGGDA